MRLQTLAALASITLAALVAVEPAAQAQPAPAVAFYTPPSPLPPGRPGDLIRTEPFTTPVPLPAKATRIMYRSSDTHGAPIAVTGAVLDPIAPWTGPGPRPVVGFAVGTQGQGDQCAPSRLLGEVVHYTPPLDLMAEYESAFIGLLLAQGIAVAVSDYEGFGTPGPHTYLNPISEAHAVIDSVRAAQRLPGTGIAPEGPVGFWGYSQGGAASGAAAEEVGGYAPELDVRGSYVGAAPADLAGLFQNLDSTVLRTVIAWFLNGLRSAFPETGSAIDALLNPAGKALLADAADECDAEIVLRHGLQPTDTYTNSGRPLAEAVLDDPVIRPVIDRLRLGGRAPSAPVLVTGGAGDDIVPVALVRGLASSWCAKGATVQLVESPVPLVLPGLTLGHDVNALALNAGSGLQWLRDRFSGVPAPSSC